MAIDTRLAVDVLKEIEERYAVETVRVEGLSVWQFLRNSYAFAQYYRMVGTERDAGTQQPLLVRRAKQYRNLIWHLPQFFARTDYWISTSVLENREYEGKIIHKLLHGLTRKEPENFTTFLEPTNHYLPSGLSYASKHVTSILPFYYHRKFVRSQDSAAIQIENEDLLQLINETYKFDVDYRLNIWDFLQYHRAFVWRLSINQPKALIHTCHYGLMNQAMTWAAKQKNIPVISIQHGVVLKEHPIFQVFRDLGHETFPDYFWSMGDYVRQEIHPNHIEPKHVIPVGSYYIHLRQQNLKSDKDAAEWVAEAKGDRKRVVLVASQEPIQDKLVAFINHAAAIDRRTCYLFLPRRRELFEGYQLESNVVLVENFDFYRLVGLVDVHATVYSTTALESVAFGTPNILINIDGMSEKILKRIFSDDLNINRFADTPSSFVEQLESLPERFCVKEYGQRFFTDRHEEKISDSFAEILQNHQLTRDH